MLLQFTSNKIDDTTIRQLQYVDMTDKITPTEKTPNINVIDEVTRKKTSSKTVAATFLSKRINWHEK